MKRADVMHLEPVRPSARLTFGLHRQMRPSRSRPVATALLWPSQVGWRPTLLRENGAGDRRGSHVRDRNGQNANTP